MHFLKVPAYLLLTKEIRDLFKTLVIPLNTLYLQQI
ncbi:MAG: hypothetical protein JWO06_3366 [Bacteroidota bacterium]|nr:hypothetical protein [Bacteroidota bacterium]